MKKVYIDGKEYIAKSAENGSFLLIPEDDSVEVDISFTKKDLSLIASILWLLANSTSCYFGIPDYTNGATVYHLSDESLETADKIIDTIDKKHEGLASGDSFEQWFDVYTPEQKWRYMQGVDTES